MKKNIVVLLALSAMTAPLAVFAASEWNTQDYVLYPGDFDGDGRTDVLYIAKDTLHPSGIARSDGNGPNIPWQSWPNNYLGISWAPNAATAVVGDFNGDGRDDVLLQRTTPGDHYLVLTNNQGKLMSIAQTIPDAHLGVNWSAKDHRIISGDFNGDGRDDLFLQATRSNLTNVVALANGAGQFPAGSPAQWWADTYLGFKWSVSSALVYAGDFTGDGKDDLLIQAKPDIVMIDYDVPIPVLRFRPNSFGIVKADDVGTPFDTIQQFWNRNHLGADWSASNSNVVVGDFDGDGKDDVFLQAMRTGNVNRLFRTDGAGQLTNANSLLDATLTNAIGSSYRVILSNVDGGAQVGLYLQSTSPAGDNLFANNITTSTVTTTPHTALHQVVGRTSGGYSVGVNGDANYSIPLMTPPGTNGLSPTLSLSYTSNGGNGWAGLGFSIPGLSAITRCNGTLAQDGNGFGVNFVPNDRYCIDGRRLRLASGTYGTAGSTYRTEVETFALITMTAVNSFGPASFEVRTADGLIYEYGATSGSSIKLLADTGTALSTVPLLWAVNRIRDRSNNYIDFTYTQDTTNGGYYPQEISWTGNTGGGGTAAKYKAVFVNETANRPDPIMNGFPSVPFLSGAKGAFNYFKRLSRIDVFYIPTNRLVRRYQLAYEPAGGTGAVSRVASVQECGLDAADCLAATTFSWLTPVPAAVVSSTGQSVPAGVTPLVMDISGDGRDDLVWSSSATSGSGNWFYKIADGAGGFGPTFDSGIGNTNYTSAQIISWDNDARQDLIVPLSGGTWWVLRSNGAGFDAASNTNITATFPTSFADINGDGRDDMIRKFNGLSIRLRSGSGFGTESVGLVPAWPVASIFSGGARRMDFDGDGLEDLVIVIDQVDAFGTHTFKTQTVYGNSTSLRAGLDFGTITYVGSGDFNGDHLSDVAWIAGGTLRTTISPSSGPAASAGSVAIADWDGDGKDDALLGGTQWQFARSTGTGFATPTTTGINFFASQVGDVDGNGFDDLVMVDAGVIKTARQNSASPLAFRDLLQTVTDGFGVAATFAYTGLDDATVHTPAPGDFSNTNATWPIVRSVVATDGSGTGSTYTLTFAYEGAKYGQDGRPFAGFAKRTIVDGSAGHNVKTEESYEQQWPFVGLLKSVVIKQSTGTVIQETTNTWKSIAYGSGFSLRRFPYISTSTTTDRAVSVGTPDGTPMRTTTTTLPGTDGVDGIDAPSGLVKDVTTTTTESGTGLFTGQSKSMRVVHTSILNDQTANWCVGRPQTTQQTNSTTLATGTAITRTIGRAWNTASGQCRMDSITKEPGDPQLQVLAAYEYDTFGNVKKLTLTGAGMTPRITQVFWGTTGQFPEKVTNALLQETNQTFTPELGKVATITDPNNLTTELKYDSFGRTLSEKGPDGTSTTWSLVAYAGDAPRVRYYVEEVARRVDTSPIKTTQAYFDQFDRAYYVFEQVPAGTGYSWSTRKVDFDARGRTTTRQEPWFLGASQSGSTVNEYDALDRVIAERLYTAGGALDRTTKIDYKGLAQTITDPRTFTTTRYVTGWGDLARVTDAAAANTDYTYDAFSGIKTVTDALANVVTSVSYNNVGMKTGMTDMDTGSWIFVPNALGELEKVRDQRTLSPNWTAQYTYDELGRLKKRIETEGTTDWTWGTSAGAHNIGSLESVTMPGYTENLTYDPTGRITTRSILTDVTYLLDYGYDPQTGNLATFTYPMSTAAPRFALSYAYSYGQMTRIQRADSGGSTVYWSLNALNARRNVTDESLGNGLRVASSFNPLTGTLDTRQSGVGGGTSVQNLAYQWDKNFNLKQRQDLRQGLTEVFNYDALNRLDDSTLNGTQNLNVDYDVIGNITKKSDVSASNYTYHATKKHAVATAGSYTFTYDADGNMLTDGQGGTASWYSNNLANTVSTPGNSSQFFYGPDRSRYKQVRTAGATTETTMYASVFEKITVGTQITWKHYIPSPAGLVAAYIRRNDSTESTVYFTNDHLGSIDTLSDTLGVPLARLSYDAFGKRRNNTGWAGAVPAGDMSAVDAATHRGYTQHEMLDKVGLIHMNGRVFNPTVGRFLSADPIVQAPDNPQSLNRYSYVFNNPLTYVDPSGYCGATSVSVVDGGIQSPNQIARSRRSPNADLADGSNRPSLNVPCPTDMWWLTFRAMFNDAQAGRPTGNNNGAAGALFAAAGEGLQSRASGDAAGTLSRNGRVPAQSLSDALYYPGYFPIARLDLGFASLPVNGSLNFINGLANGASDFAGWVLQPFDTYAGEFITLETAFPGGGIAAGPTILLGNASRSIRAANATGTALVRMVDAAYNYGVIRFVAGYQVGGTFGRVGTVYNVNLWALYKTPAKEGLGALIAAFRAEAAAAGATEISITGTAVINQGLLNISEAAAARFGLQYTKMSDSSILLRGSVQ